MYALLKIKLLKSCQMEKNNVINADKTVCKEYQVPELIDLNNLNEAEALPPQCANGSGNGFSCNSGTSGPI